ncbi:MAG: DUF1738 domain-containing protein [Epsilonproteobacteria bacterium]|nr:DUF1738 domain-containing protein [Campylobacterota bacterium]
MITREDVEKEIYKMYKVHPGMKDIDYKVRYRAEDLAKNYTKDDVKGMKGAFLPQDRKLLIAAENHADLEDVRTTIKHELYGHAATYNMEKEQKRDLLNGIQILQKDPKVKEYWDLVNKLHPDYTKDMQAEEVFAYMTEKSEVGLKIVNDVNYRVRSYDDIKNVSHHLQNDMLTGRATQKIRPERNDIQFRKEDYAEKVATQFIDAMEKGTAPWTKPWTADELSKSVPYNASTGNRYQGINMINLMGKSMETGDPRFLTYKQAQGMDANVKKGSKGIGIEYWQFTKEEIAKDKDGKKIYIDGKPKKIQVKLDKPRVYYATVFNGKDIEGLPELKVEKDSVKEFNANKEAENVLKHSGASIRHQAGDRAYYSPRADEIVLPNKDQFKSEAAYYGTALHELSHWTGHESRLNRDMSGKFGTPSYAKEELRAEIGSFMTAAKIGAPYEPNASHAYVENWVSLLKDKPKEIFHASSDANKISNYIIDLSRDKNIEVG